MKICARCGQRFENRGWTCPACHATPLFSKGHPVFSPETADRNEGYEADHFRKLTGIERVSFWFRSRNRLITWAIHRYFPTAQNLFEIGCGTGFVLSGIERAFPHLSLYGSEVFSVGLAYAEKRLRRVRLFQMDARHIPFADEFDVIGAFDVLEHIQEDDRVLEQMYRAVRPGGGVIISVPQHPRLWGRFDEMTCHVRRYTRKDLKQKMLRAGFAVEAVTSFTSLLLPLMALSRFRTRQGRGDPLAGLKLGGPANALMGRVMDVERVLIRTGLSMPWGGSLLIIGRKR